MNITQQIKQSIESRFGDGQLFTVLDFPELDKIHGRRHIRSTLATLCGSKCKYLTVESKIKSGIGNMPPVNRYRLAIPAVDVDCVAEIPAGTITKAHSMKTPPVRPGRYGVRFWDRKEATRIWRDGSWWNDNGNPLNPCFVMEWWGVTR